MDKKDHFRSKQAYKRDLSQRRDRRSAQGVAPNAKKGGHGGWGTVFDELKNKSFDVDDPNYAPDEQMNAK